MRGHTWQTLIAGTAIVVAVAALSACSSSRSHPSAAGRTVSATATQATGSAHVGDLTITGGYIPQPASPDVAAAYFTVTNSGSSADTLTKVVTSVTTKVMAMTETDSGATGAMTDLLKVVVPAHGSFAFTPGHAHLMLQNPARALREGDRVSMTVTFARAGTVVLTLPVLSVTGPAGGQSSPAGTGGMSGMPGMPGTPGTPGMSSG